MSHLRDYTTGEAAAIVELSLRTIVRHCEAGLLKCYYIGAMSKHRRIAAAALLAYIREYNLPGAERVASEVATKSSDGRAEDCRR